MASIPPAVLQPALDAAMQVTTVTGDAHRGPPVVVASSGAAGAGAAVAILMGPGDALDVKGQLSERSWRIVAAFRNDTQGTDLVEWART